MSLPLALYVEVSSGPVPGGGMVLGEWGGGLLRPGTVLWRDALGTIWVVLVASEGAGAGERSEAPVSRSRRARRGA